MRTDFVSRLQDNSVRLECINSRGETSVGTGFYYTVENGQKNEIPAIITNRHVTNDSHTVRIKVTHFDIETGEEPKHDYFEINDERLLIINHPDNQVDLCAIMIGNLINYLADNGRQLLYNSLNEKNIPNQSTLHDLTPREEIIMLGYPNGLWDEVNNKPLIRSGYSATHPGDLWNGKKEFIADIACYPGSSGSPVYIYNDGQYYNHKEKSVTLGQRFVFLGINRAVFLHNSMGDVIEIETPTNMSVAHFNVPNGLALIIQSSELIPLGDSIKQQIS